MVRKKQRRLGKRGASRLGCLFMILVVAFVAYYGINFGGSYLRYYKMLDAMKSEARLAPSLENDAIRRRLRNRANELSLPEAAFNFQIRRKSRPREIEISTSWTEPIELPFYVYMFTFSPVAKAPL